MVLLAGTAFTHVEKPLAALTAEQVQAGAFAVTVSVDLTEDAAAAQRWAKALLPRLGKAVAQARNDLAASHHPLWQDGWRDPDTDPPLDLTAFHDKLNPQLIQIGVGYFEVWVDDRTLFLGHSQLVGYLPESLDALAAGDFGPGSPDLFG